MATEEYQGHSSIHQHHIIQYFKVEARKMGNPVFTVFDTLDVDASTQILTDKQLEECSDEIVGKYKPQMDNVVKAIRTKSVPPSV